MSKEEEGTMDATGIGEEFLLEHDSELKKHEDEFVFDENTIIKTAEVNAVVEEIREIIDDRIKTSPTQSRENSSHRQSKKQAPAMLIIEKQ